MSAVTVRNDSREAGFTLLELLVAATLLAFLMAILFGGLRTGTRVWEASNSRDSDIARLLSTQNFLRRQISELHPLRLQERAGQSPYVAFDGAPSSVTFTGLLPPHFNVGGFQLIRIGLLEDANGEHLAVEWQTFDPEGAPSADVPKEQKARLIENVAAVGIQYFGSDNPGGDAAWVDEWRERQTPPSLIRLQVAFDDGDQRYWPELVVRIQTTPSPIDRNPDEGEDEGDDDEVQNG